MDRIPIAGQTGYLILNEDGAVISSSGELENDERTASIIMDLLTLTTHIDPLGFPTEEGFKRLSLSYKTHSYIICLSNRKIHIIKKMNSLEDSLSINV